MVMHAGNVSFLLKKKKQNNTADLTATNDNFF